MACAVATLRGLLRCVEGSATKQMLTHLLRLFTFCRISKAHNISGQHAAEQGPSVQSTTMHSCRQSGACSSRAFTGHSFSVVRLPW